MLNILFHFVAPQSPKSFPKFTRPFSEEMRFFTITQYECLTASVPEI